MTDPPTTICCLLDSSSSSDDDNLVVLRNDFPSKRQKVSVAASPSKKASFGDDDDSDDSDDIPMESIFAKKSAAAPPSHRRRRPLAAWNRQDVPASPSTCGSDSCVSFIGKKPVATTTVATTTVATTTVATTTVATTTARVFQRERQQLEKERLKAERQAVAQRRKDAKEQERLSKQRQKQRQKEEREAVRQQDKQENRDRKLAAQQSTGKFAVQEIGLVVHPHLTQQDYLKETFEVFQETYPELTESRGVDKGAIQFIRRDYVTGGIKAASRAFQEKNGTGYHLCDRLLIVFSDPNEFLVLMERSDVEDDYPNLEEWLDKTNAAWKTKWNRTDNPRIVILLPGILQEVHRRWNAASRKERLSLVTDTDMNDAIVWLHVSFRVECQPTTSLEDVLAFLLKMTRTISEEPYIQQVTELECVKKIKTQLPDADSATQLERANDTWIRMLQQVPRMSVTRAEHLAKFYPTARSLWQAYQSSDSDDSKARMVTHLLGDRQYKKLSEQLSKVMTSNNPNELLS